MTRSAGYVFGGLGLQTGAASVALYFMNLAIWSVLTAMLGGALTLIGLGLIMWALHPLRAGANEEVKLIEYIPAQLEVA